jgi:hypothetical protein
MTPVGYAAWMGESTYAMGTTTVVNQGASAISTSVGAQGGTSAAITAAANGATAASLNTFAGMTERGLLGEDPIDPVSLATDFGTGLVVGAGFSLLDEASAGHLANIERQFNKHANEFSGHWLEPMIRNSAPTSTPFTTGISTAQDVLDPLQEIYQRVIPNLHRRRPRAR